MPTEQPVRVSRDGLASNFFRTPHIVLPQVGFGRPVKQPPKSAFHQSPDGYTVLKFAVDSAGREIVVDKTTVTGCVLVCVNVPFVGDERSQISRVIIRADGDRVTYARAKVGTYSQFSWTPSGLYTFSIIDRCAELTLPRRTGYGICSA